MASPWQQLLLCLCSLTCAHLRTLFTVGSPGFTHCAAAHLLGEKGGQSVLAFPVLRRYPEAFALLGWSLRLWQRRRRDFIWESQIPCCSEYAEYEKPDTYRHIDSCPTPSQPCRNIWSCLVCSDTVHSDRLPVWSTRWYLQSPEARSKKLF